MGGGNGLGDRVATGARKKAYIRPYGTQLLRMFMYICIQIMEKRKEKENERRGNGTRETEQIG